MRKCETCGHSRYTEKHHPDGTKQIITIQENGKRGIQKLELTVTNIDKMMQIKRNKSGRAKVKTVHKNPDVYHIICANCHKLITQGKYTYSELKESYQAELQVARDIKSKVVLLLQEITEYNIPKQLRFRSMELEDNISSDRIAIQVV